MHPITHLLVGWTLANAAGLGKRDRMLVTVAGVIPDIDGLGVLADVLTERGPALVNRRILELGCGVGLPGIVARKLGANVIQTDHDALALALSRHNAALNRVTAARVAFGASRPKAANSRVWLLTSCST